MRIDSRKIEAFRKLVWEHYRLRGRHDLPWRKTRDPFRILVSEVMLQQTQVDRVIPFYKDFLKRFPNARALASAPLGDVLRAWQGLGYNRRAKMLQQAASEITTKWKGRFPKNVEDIESLPGVGPYTARAVAAFAYNADSIFIETNIRATVIHHFFATTPRINGLVSDTHIQAILERAYPAGRAREWYSALMDYGAALKREGVRTNARMKGYSRQKPFEGSLRQARGAVLRSLVEGPLTTSKVILLLGIDRKEQVKAAVATLVKDGLVQARSGRMRLVGDMHP